MIPEPYWWLTQQIFWGTLVWLGLSIPAYLLLLGWQRYLTKWPLDTARGIWGYAPAKPTAYQRFRERISAAYASLGANSVRVVLEHKHKRLRRDLDTIRQVLDRRLQQISSATIGAGGETLLDLLRGFKADVDRALTFGVLEDEFADDTVKRKQSQFYTILGLITVTILASINFGLLYTYFSESTEGQRIPLLDIDLALALSVFLPGVELCAGVGAKFIEEMDSFVKYILWAIVALVLVAFGSWEFTIFYQLFDGQFQQMIGFTRGGVTHYITSLVGPGLTFLQALFGYTLLKYMSQWRALKTHQTIKDQIGDANRFVDDLPSRYGAIERAGASACQSLDELASQLNGRDQAERPVASAIAEQREAMRSAIDEVNPEKWAAHAAGADSEQQAVKAQAWMFALLTVICLAVFTYAAGPIIARSGILGLKSLFASFVVAFGAGIACFIAGAHLFDRTTVSYESRGQWYAAISPQDVAYKVAAAMALLIAIVGIVWVCVDVAGLAGMARALLLVSLLIGMTIAGSYHDRISQGFGFLGRVMSAIFVLAVASAFYALLGLVVLIATVAGTLLHLLIAIAAFPLTLLTGLRRRKEENSENQTRLAPT